MAAAPAQVGAVQPQPDAHADATGDGVHGPAQPGHTLWHPRASRPSVRRTICGRCWLPASTKCFRCYARSVAGRCALLPSSSTALMSGKYWSTSGWIPSHPLCPQHAGHRCGMGSMRLTMWALRLGLTGMRQHNRHRTLRSISASVGERNGRLLLTRCGLVCVISTPHRTCTHPARLRATCSTLKTTKSDRLGRPKSVQYLLSCD